MSTNAKSNSQEVLPVSLRKAASERKYVNDKKDKKTKGLINEPFLKEWEYWGIIANTYPYDAVFKKHDLLIPKREVDEVNLNESEKLELKKILEEVSNLYDLWLVNFKSMQSVTHHHHIHLLTYKDTRQELGF